MREHLNPANLITSASLSAGSLALVLAADGHVIAAAVAVAIAALLDSFDGIVARRLESCGRFGCQLDSLSDLVAFGVAPALMLHESTVHAVPVLGIAACLAFVLAGAWRLARFSLVQDKDHFVGLPIPVAGLIVAATAALTLPAALALALTLALALLMVSAIRFPTLLTVTRRFSEAELPRPRRRAPHAHRRSARRWLSTRRGRGRRARPGARRDSTADAQRAMPGRPEGGGNPHEEDLAPAPALRRASPGRRRQR